VALVEEKEREFNVSRQNEKKSDDEKKAFQDARLHSYEHIFTSQKPLPLNELFKPANDTKNVTPKRLVIAAQAGIGKSVLCQFLAYVWASQGKSLPQTLPPSQTTLLSTVQQSLQHFDYLFVIRLRDIDVEQLNPKKLWQSLIEIILSQCLTTFDYAEQIDHIENLIHALKATQHKILWLLDGYDEVITHLKDQHNRDTPLKILLDFLHDMKAPWSILKTSRPIASKNLTSDRQLELMGFLDPQIEEFVQQRLNHTARAQRCVTFLKSNPSVWGTAHIPLNLALLTQLYQDSQFNLSIEHLTLTRLYDQIIIHLARKYLLKRPIKPFTTQQVQELSADQVLCECYSVLYFLEQLAHQALLDPQAIMSILLSNHLVTQVKKLFNERSKEPINLEEVRRFGLFHQATRRKNASEADYFFSHLTFQEYFAARALARSLWQSQKFSKDQLSLQDKWSIELQSTNTLSLINTEKYTLQYYIVWQFLAGLLHTPDRSSEFTLTERQRHRAIQGFWSAIEQLPLALHPLHHRCLIVRLLDEVVDENALDELRQPISKKWSQIQKVV
jgi:hypothetical protein